MQVYIEVHTLKNLWNKSIDIGSDMTLRQMKNKINSTLRLSGRIEDNLFHNFKAKKKNWNNPKKSFSK